MNNLASAVASYTPKVPVTTDQADAIREKVADTLHGLAAEIDDYLRGLPEGGEELLPEEEQVIIITSPPPP